MADVQVSSIEGNRSGDTNVKEMCTSLINTFSNITALTSFRHTHTHTVLSRDAIACILYCSTVTVMFK